MKVCLLLIAFMLLHVSVASAQDTSKISNEKFVADYAADVGQKVSSVKEKLNKKSEKALRSLEKQEAKMRRKLSKLDSIAARKMLADANAKYAALKEKLANPGNLNQYLPSLDSMGTALKFLNGSGAHTEKVNAALGKVKDLQWRSTPLIKKTY